MQKLLSFFLLLVILSAGYVASAQVMPDFVLRTAQEINAIYGEGTIDINNTGWDWRGGSIGDNFPLTEGCTSPITIPTSTSATEYYRVFFDTNFDGVDDWKVVVYNDYTYFGLCAAPQYTCGLLETRLAVGMVGHVDRNGFPNNMRAQPGESGELVGEIPPGAEFTVIDGPRCGSDISFWLVSYNGIQGWTAEGQGDQYFLIPGIASEGVEIIPTEGGPTPIAQPTQIPTYTCAGITSRLNIGVMAQVTPGLPNNLRAQPGESGAYLGEIPPGIPFTIVGGPECNSNLLWWQVNYQGTIGWTAEAGSIDDFWIAPLGFDTTTITADTINELASYTTLVPQVSDAPLATYINNRNEVFALWSNHEAIWTPEDPAAALPLSWRVRSEQQLTNPPLASRMDANGDMVRLVRNLQNNQLVSLEGGTFFDEFDLSLNNTTLDIAAFHPDDGDMIVLSPRGMGFVFVNADPNSPTYRQVSQSARSLSPNEIYTNIKFSGDGTRMAALTDADNIMIWSGVDANPGTWQASYPIISPSDLNVFDFALSPDGSKLIVTGIQESSNSRIGFYQIYNLTDTNAGTPELFVIGFNTPVTAIEFTPDGSMYVITPSATELAVHDTESDSLLVFFSELTEPLADISFNADGSLMATTSQTGIVTMWKIN